MSAIRFVRSRVLKAATRKAVVGPVLAGLVVAMAGMGIWTRSAYAARARAEAAAKRQSVTLNQVMAKLNRMQSAMRQEASALEMKMASVERQNTELAAYEFRAHNDAAHMELASERLPAYGQPGPMAPQFSSTTTSAVNAVMQTQICLDGDLQGGASFSPEVGAELGAEGNLGLEAFGNGLDAKLGAHLGATLGLHLGGDLGVSVHRCLQFNTFGILDQLATSSVDNMVSNIDNGQVNMATGLVNAFNNFQQLGNTAVTAGMNALSSLTTNDSPQQLLNSLDNPSGTFGQYTNLIDSLPLPGTVQQLLTDPTSLLPQPQLLSSSDICGYSSNQGGLLGTLCGQIPNNLANSSAIQNAVGLYSNVQGAITNFQASLGGLQTGVGNLCNSVNGVVSGLDGASLSIPPSTVGIPVGINFTPPSLHFHTDTILGVNFQVVDGISAPPPSLVDESGGQEDHAY